MQTLEMRGGFADPGKTSPPSVPPIRPTSNRSFTAKVSPLSGPSAAPCTVSDLSMKALLGSSSEEAPTGLPAVAAERTCMRPDSNTTPRSATAGDAEGWVAVRSAGRERAPAR